MLREFADCRQIGWFKAGQTQCMLQRLASVIIEPWDISRHSVSDYSAYGRKQNSARYSLPLPPYPVPLKECLRLRAGTGYRGRLLVASAVIVGCTMGQSLPETPGPGTEATLWELVQPDRFGWPARFTCRRTLRDQHPLALVGKSPDEMNEMLMAIGVWPADCHGGFTIRSLHRLPNKMSELVGTAPESQ
jgi:hypothetical protein